MSEIKLCPFCGSLPIVQDVNENRIIAYVECVSEKCPAKPDVFDDTLEAAISRWNERAT